MTPKILVITPVNHIKGIPELLESIGSVKYLDNPTQKEVEDQIDEVNALFTNPNKSNVYISRDLLQKGNNLSVVCTASTGRDHIDIDAAQELNKTILSLKNDFEVINKISSTAEHAFSLMLSVLRWIPQANSDTKSGNWDYEPFIGRQMDHLTLGVIGYGRLGKLFTHYCKAFGSRVLVYDPYVKVENESNGEVIQTNLDELLIESDIISVHVHLDKETYKMVNKSWFDKMKDTVILINTSRGDVINEEDLIFFLENNPKSRVGADVIANEIDQDKGSSLLRFAEKSNRVIITPHIGGMTIEGQQIAYTHAAMKLKEFFE